jgi:hypothetical protein
VGFKVARLWCLVGGLCEQHLESCSVANNVRPDRFSDPNKVFRVECDGGFISGHGIDLGADKLSQAKNAFGGGS